jgi:hypothetical protein
MKYNGREGKQSEHKLIAPHMLTLPNDIMNKLTRAYEVARYVARDDNRDIPLSQKALVAKELGGDRSRVR